MDMEKTNDIVVTILTLAYNHEPYIRQCLDGIVMQQTNFKFELLIHDDASTDGTANIIREYELKYPEIIKPIYQKENQYSKKVPIGVTYLYPRAKGKYIALCEGDDYWTDSLKLQKQVDFLEANPEYVMCSSHFKFLDDKTGVFSNDRMPNIKEGIEYDLKTLINEKWYFQPLTVMFRLSMLNLEEYFRYPITKDAVLFFHLLKKGKGYLLSQEFGVYRKHSEGVWSGISYCGQLKNEIQARIGIYKVEQSYEAAYFVRHIFVNLIGRKWMLQEWQLMLIAFNIISNHFGVFSTLKMFINKMLWNKKLGE